MGHEAKLSPSSTGDQGKAQRFLLLCPMQPKERFPHGCCDEPMFAPSRPWGCSISRLSHLTRWAPGERRNRAGVGAACLSSPSVEGPTCSHALALAAHTVVSCAGLYWHPTSPVLAGCGDAVPCASGELWCPLPTAMGPTKALCAVKDRPAPLPFSFLSSLSLASHTGERTEVPHRQNGLC